MRIGPEWSDAKTLCESPVLLLFWSSKMKKHCHRSFPVVWVLFGEQENHLKRNHLERFEPLEERLKLLPLDESSVCQDGERQAFLDAEEKFLGVCGGCKPVGFWWVGILFVLFNVWQIVRNRKKKTLSSRSASTIPECFQIPKRMMTCVFCFL